MAFSDSMRECLGGSGARVEVVMDKPRAVRGGVCPVRVHVRGGSGDTFVRSVVVRLLAASRHWADGDGQMIDEAQAGRLSNRRHLTPGWTRALVSETRIDVNERVSADGSTSIEAQMPVPDDCPASGPASVVTINAQAVIEGQIDPTGSAAITIM